MNAWRKATISVAILAAVVVSVVLATGGSGNPGVVRATPTETSSSPPSAPPATPAQPVASRDPTAMPGPAFDGEEVREPTAHKPQSKLWFHDGRWWGILLTLADEYTIHWLEWGTQEWHDSGVLVDDRPGTYADAVVAGDRLYVASAGAHRTNAETRARPLPDSERAIVRRYTYDASAGRYQLDPGFPVRVTEGGVSAVTIDLDVDGRPWAAFLLDGQAWITTTDGDDRRWAEPFEVPSENAVGVTQAAIVAYESEIAVLWSNESEDALYFASHQTGAPIEDWSTSRIIVEGFENTDDHINVKAVEGASGGIYAVVKTSLDDVRPRLSDRELILLLARVGDSDEWRKIVVGRVRDGHSRPVLLIDESARDVYVFATAPGRFGDVYVKRSRLDDLRFAAGRGQLFMSDPNHAISSPTTTKQPVSTETGIVVMATDTSTNRVVHGAMSLGSVEPGIGSELAGAGVTPPDGGAPTTVFHDTFDAYPAGEAPGTPWDLTEKPAGLMTVVEGLNGMAARVHSADGAAIRACHHAAAGDSTVLDVSAGFQVERLGSNDTYVLSIRAPDSELASLRVMPDGELAYIVGEEKEGTGVVLDVGAWYTAAMHLDLTQRTYDWLIADAGSGAAVASGTGVAFAAAPDPRPDRICFLSAEGTDARGLVIDDVRLDRSTPGAR